MEQEKTNLELHRTGGVIQAVKHVQRYADALSDGAITNLESASIPITSAERNERKRQPKKLLQPSLLLPTFAVTLTLPLYLMTKNQLTLQMHQLRPLHQMTAMNLME